MPKETMTFKKRIAKFYGKIIGIIAICKKSCVGQYELGVLLKIHEVFFVSSLLFKCVSLTQTIEYVQTINHSKIYR